MAKVKCKSCDGTGKVEHRQGSTLFECYVVVDERKDIYGVFDNEELAREYIERQQICFTLEIIRRTLVQAKPCYCKNRKV